jgi:transcriptional regulator with XRE-family HTH domain
MSATPEAVSAEVVEGKPESEGTKGGVEAEVKNEAVKQETPADWRSDLPDDLKKTAERFTSKADAVRAIESFRKRESQVRVPGKDATEDEIKAYRKAVGIPEKPDAYEFPDLPKDQEMTEELKASRETWGKRFHELGVSKATAKLLVQLVDEDGQKYLASQVAADKSFAKAQEDALRAEWKGDEYEKNKTQANRAFAEIANRSGISLEALTKIETKDGRFLMDRAEIVKMFAVIGKEMAEGTLGPAISESERETVDDQIREVRKEIQEAQNEGDSKRANRLYQSEQKLLAKMGNKPIVGSAGRSA